MCNASNSLFSFGIRCQSMNIIESLKDYDRLYYETGESPVSDVEYDRLKDLAKSKYPRDDYFNTVGAITRDKVKLPYVLGSLNKKKPDTICKWLDDNSGPYVVSEKIDGVSVFVEYNNGEVSFASTRGDGVYGKDITEKAKQFFPIIENGSKFMLRGEVVITDDDHLKFGYSTKRNAVAGILNRDEGKHLNILKVKMYECIEYAELKTKSEYERMVLIESLGFETPEWTTMKDLSLEYLLEMIRISNTKRYECDGLVISINESDREDVLYPSNKIAFKVQGETYTTTVEFVEWNVTRTGRVVPVVVMKPVDINGVSVRRASGFNAQFVSDNHITEGAEVEIIRSGDVIPYILSVNNGSKHSNLPETCPSCDSFLTISGKDLVCINNKCMNQAYKRVENFLVKMGCENVTHITLEKLGIDTVERAYTITESEIKQHEGFEDRRSSQVVNEIQGTLKSPVSQSTLLSAFGIKGIGKRMSDTLIECFETVENVLSYPIDRLKGCFGVGDIVAKNIVVNSADCLDLLEFLISKGLTFEEVKKMGNLNLSGMCVAVTGKTSMKRKDIEELVNENGGVLKGISKDVDILICADPDSTSAKMKKAREYGIKIVTLEEFLDMI